MNIPAQRIPWLNYCETVRGCYGGDAVDLERQIAVALQQLSHHSCTETIMEVRALLRVRLALASTLQERARLRKLYGSYLILWPELMEPVDGCASLLGDVTSEVSDHATRLLSPHGTN